MVVLQGSLATKMPHPSSFQPNGEEHVSGPWKFQTWEDWLDMFQEGHWYSCAQSFDSSCEGIFTE